MSFRDEFESEIFNDGYVFGFKDGKQYYKDLIKNKMKTLEKKYNDFKDMTVFNVPKKIESDFIKYMVYKELIENE